jgi:Predicted enzyme related to lactoylglutathione lyase
MDMKLEVVVIPVSDVDRAKAFYEKLGFRLDIDYARDQDHRVVQFTPPGSEASIHIGKGITSAAPASVQNLYLIVSDIEKARADLMGRGIDVSEVFHFAGLLGPRVTGRIRNMGPTDRLPRSKIRTGTDGCCRKSRRDFPAANGSRSTRSDGRSHTFRAPSRNGTAPRPVRKVACQT